MSHDALRGSRGRHAVPGVDPLRPEYKREADRLGDLLGSDRPQLRGVIGHMERQMNREQIKNSSRKKTSYGEEETSSERADAALLATRHRSDCYLSNDEER
jgi:hypothetical protein